MTKNITLAAVVALAMATAGCTMTGDGKPMSEGGMKPPTAEARALAEKLVFAESGFHQDQPMQEGGTGRDRMTQDETQKICTDVALSGKPIDNATAAKVKSMARASIKYPAGGIKLGDWERGRVLAWSGFGFRTAHNPDDHAKREPGATCYNCHQLATDRTGGTIGPSLTNYGKIRGAEPEIQKYVYDMIYNPNATFPCTNMPRFGANGILTEHQIADVMAYLFDPESLVNK
jgi:sulfur-oxidizing protein SoxX